MNIASEEWAALEIFRTDALQDGGHSAKEIDKRRFVDDS